MLRRILFFLFLFFLIFTSFLPPKSFAQGAPTCSARADSVRRSEGKPVPVPADENDKAIAVEMSTSGFDGDVSILIAPRGKEPQKVLKEDATAFNEDMATYSVGGDGKITIPLLVNRRGYYKNGPRDDENNPAFNAWPYDIFVVPPGEGNSERAYCVATIKAKPNVGGDTDYCTVTYLTEKNDYTRPGTNVFFRVNFQGSSNTGDNDTHRVVLKSRYGPETGDLWTPTTADLKATEGWKIPRSSLPIGTYNIEVREFAKNLIPPFDDEGKRCSPEWPFLIETEENGGGHECSVNSVGCDYRNVVPNAPLSQPCDDKDYTTRSGCLKIKTALGTVGTGATEFVRWVLGFVLGISGGIVLIIIIITGYRLMTSQGDPEKVKNAREQLTAAIVGLLFIIFSLVILQFITADILQLPGFGS